MAFKPQFLTKLEPSSLFTQPSTIPSVQPQVLPPNFWLYSSNGDDIATVSTNGYFVYFADWLNTLAYNNGQLFQVGDLIYINCSDGTGWLSVTQVQPIIETLAATLGPNSVTTADIQNGAVTSAKLAASAVIAGTIAAGTIVNADVNAAAAIAYSKLAALASGNIIVGSAGTVPTSVAMSGDVAIVASGATTIQANVVDSVKLSEDTLQYVSVTVSAAQMALLYANPLLMIASIGAHELIVIDHCVIEFDYNAAQYTAGGALGLQYDNTAHLAGVAASSTEAAATINGFTADNMFRLTGATVGLAANMTNKGIFLSNDTAAFATGDGTMTVNLTYHVVQTVA